ncbi:MAG: M23 family metallopeptidase [Treponema sp.]
MREQDCAAASGTVSFVGYSNIFGNYIIVKHSNGYQTLYGHLSKTLARKGQHVSQGTRIGLVGSTGYSTGPTSILRFSKTANSSTR